MNYKDIIKTIVLSLMILAPSLGATLVDEVIVDKEKVEYRDNQIEQENKTLEKKISESEDKAENRAEVNKKEIIIEVVCCMLVGVFFSLGMVILNTKPEAQFGGYQAIIPILLSSIVPILTELVCYKIKAIPSPISHIVTPILICISAFLIFTLAPPHGLKPDGGTNKVTILEGCYFGTVIFTTVVFYVVSFIIYLVKKAYNPAKLPTKPESKEP